MHLVVDDEPPASVVEESHVREILGAARAVREDLIRRDGDRAKLLRCAVVLADVVGGQRRTFEEFTLPLPAGGHTRDEDEGLRLQGRHGGERDDGLARSTGEDNDPGAAVGRTGAQECIAGVALVVAQREGIARGSHVDEIQPDRVAILEARLVDARVADLQQRLLQHAAARGVDGKRVVADAGPEQRRDGLVPGQAAGEKRIRGMQHQRGAGSLSGAEHESSVT